MDTPASHVPSRHVTALTRKPSASRPWVYRRYRVYHPAHLGVPSRSPGCTIPLTRKREAPRGTGYGGSQGSLRRLKRSQGHARAAQSRARAPLLGSLLHRGAVKGTHATCRVSSTRSTHATRRVTCSPCVASVSPNTTRSPPTPLRLPAPRSRPPPRRRRPSRKVTPRRRPHAPT
jgi:hypothetical protein